MALYLGSSHKLKINIGNIAYYLNAIFDESIESSSRLLSSDDYALTDSNDVCVELNMVRTYDAFIIAINEEID